LKSEVKSQKKLKFWGQLRVKLKKFTVKDHFAKDAEIWQPNQLKSRVKLKKIKSLMIN
jgi:hypothetical protein